MKRRAFLAATAAATLAPALASASTGWVEYIPGLVKKRLAAGETVFLDIGAAWCTTCKSQERTINALKSENPAYGKAVTFIHMDWDKYGRGELATELNVPRRSTLIVLKGDAELGRIVAGTRRADIQALMDVALTAASA
ncbi:MAG: thioredoxin family protein [Pseudomonadota bacterium]